MNKPKKHISDVIIRKCAEKIANRLFTYLSDKPYQAKRLVLEMPGKKLDGPGWGLKPMIDEIERILKEG